MSPPYSGYSRRIRLQSDDRSPKQTYVKPQIINYLAMWRRNCTVRAAIGTWTRESRGKIREAILTGRRGTGRSRARYAGCQCARHVQDRTVLVPPTSGGWRWRLCGSAGTWRSRDLGDRRRRGGLGASASKLEEVGALGPCQSSLDCLAADIRQSALRTVRSISRDAKIPRPGREVGYRVAGRRGARYLNDI